MKRKEEIIVFKESQKLRPKMVKVQWKKAEKEYKKKKVERKKKVRR